MLPTPWRRLWDLDHVPIEIDREPCLRIVVDHDAHRAVHHAQGRSRFSSGSLCRPAEAPGGGRARRRAHRHRTAFCCTSRCRTRYSTPRCRAGLCGSASAPGHPAAGRSRAAPAAPHRTAFSNMRRTCSRSVNLSMTYHGRRPRPFRRRGRAHLAGEDRRGVLFQHTRLADDPGEYGRRDRARTRTRSRKEVARTHWRQLVVVADKHHGGARAIDGLKQPAQRAGRPPSRLRPPPGCPLRSGVRPLRE